MLLRQTLRAASLALTVLASACSGGAAGPRVVPAPVTNPGQHVTLSVAPTAPPSVTP